MEPHLQAPEAGLSASGLGRRYLHTSPEYAIKATLHACESPVFAMVRTFRDEPPSRWHHPEFTMLEWYRLTTYDRLVADCHAIVRTCREAISQLDGFADPGRVRLDGDWPRRDYRELLFATTGVDVLSPPDEQRRALLSSGLDVGADWTLEEMMTVAYVDRVEPAICASSPAFIDRFPLSQAALARPCGDDSRFAERFEFYLPLLPGSDVRGNLEVANAFGELLDADEQRRRFTRESEWRRDNERPVYPMPEAMLAGLERLNEPVSGIALGLERLLCWLAEEYFGWTCGVSDWLISEPAHWRER
jgi:lysyl-tRNA synthetase class 2